MKLISKLAKSMNEFINKSDGKHTDVLVRCSKKDWEDFEKDDLTGYTFSARVYGQESSEMFQTVVFRGYRFWIDKVSDIKRISMKWKGLM